MRRVADDVDRRGLELESMLLPRALTGEGAELIAIVMIVGKGSEFKKLPETVVREFKLCASFHVSGEQGDHDFWIMAEPLQELVYAGQNSARASGEFIRQLLHVFVEKSVRFFLVGLDLHLAQDLVNDSAVRSSSDFDPGKIAASSKLFFENAMQGGHPCARRIDQGAVNVEKEEAFLICRIQAGDFKLL